jgi:hypothetical protein
MVSIENAAMADRLIIQWEKDDIEAFSLLKIDVLATGMSVIRKTYAAPVRRSSSPDAPPFSPLTRPNGTRGFSSLE